MSGKLCILLAEDHAVVRAGLKALINAESDMIVAGEAADGREAFSEIVRLQPDVAVLDLTMPGANGIEVTRQLGATGHRTRIVALTMHEDRGYLRQIFEAGAMGYVLKRAAANELILAIRAVATGGTYIDVRVAQTLVTSFVDPKERRPCEEEELSTREMEVIQLIAQGFTNKEVGTQLHLSTKTVESYKMRSMEKLGLQGRVDLVRFALARGWLRGPSETCFGPGILGQPVAS